MNRARSRASAGHHVPERPRCRRKREGAIRHLVRYDHPMRNGELQSRLDLLAAQVRDEFGLVTAVTAAPLTDSTGDDAVRFEVTLSDPLGEEGISYSDVAPIEARINELVGDLGLLVYVRFQLASEAREIAAGTYFG